ncbi:sorting nexin-18-like [Myxocyprinus asiaticus]|uniref:sorting nexin-18-like n=1 Tax=Myxocyprinus asiaticus TaxID=70543 RepID=UPI0022230938|nr:sorting nexin-18-like [Myxocyprinus asiaticus]
MALRARALYDFIPENPGEISVTENELLTLCSEEVVDGWLEGTNSRGETGLFPASYVEIIKTDPPVHGNGTSASTEYYHQTSPQRRDTSNESTPTHSATYLGHQQQRHSFQTSQGSDEDWDDDWDDNVTAEEQGGKPEKSGNPQARYSSTGSTAARRGSSQQSKSTATVGKNLNRFTTFVRSGGEAFVLGEASGLVRDGDKIFVDMGQYGLEWQANPYPFTCTVDDPTKQTKFKGMKSYMSYGLTPSHTQIQVNRRYKHFDWLYARLVEKFPVISVPHLPEKQATGRFEEDFISKRRKGLIWWMNHMTSHPVLSKCDVFQHFLTCSSNDEKAWKQGKRKAEKDDLVGANFFLTICPPALPLDLQEVESKVDAFKTFTKKMDENLLQVNVTINEFARKQITGFKKEYQRVGQAFRLMSQAFECDQQVYSIPLNKAMAYTGEIYETIGDYYAEQPRQDLEPISDLLAIYQGHLANFPDIIHVEKGALTKAKESQKDGTAGGGIHERCNIISCATLAEIQHFHRIRVRDFKAQMQHFLQQQISFFQKITGKLEEARDMYDQA